MSKHVPRRKARGTSRGAAVLAAKLLKSWRAAGSAEAPRGPGWFDSSWELQRGLVVSEGLPGDANLNEWLAAWVRDVPRAAHV